MYLCRGWEQFYRAYNLRHGYFLIFKYDGDAMLTMKVFNTTMSRMRYQDEDDASTCCLFFLSIWLCLTLIVKKNFVAFGQAIGAATATLATALATASLATAKAAARMIRNGVGKKRSRVG